MSTLRFKPGSVMTERECSTNLAINHWHAFFSRVDMFVYYQMVKPSAKPLPSLRIETVQVPLISFLVKGKDDTWEVQNLWNKWVYVNCNWKKNRWKNTFFSCQNLNPSHLGHTLPNSASRRARSDQGWEQSSFESYVGILYWLTWGA
jgi:hypothetical protein